MSTSVKITALKPPVQPIRHPLPSLPLPLETLSCISRWVSFPFSHLRLGFYLNIGVHFFQPISLIYDAGRLHALNRHDATLEHLNRADHLLSEIETHGNTSLHQALQEPRVMIEKLRETLEQERQTTSTKYLVELSHSAAAQFSTLGHKINMMANKGDLILSGVDFNPTKQDSK